MWRGLGSMNKGPNATICLVRRQNHAGTTVSWTTVQREKSSHAYKLSSNVQTACSTDSLNNCPKHSILGFSSFALKITYDWKCVNTTYRVPLFMPTACFPEGPSPPFTFCSFWRRRPCWFGKRKLSKIVINRRLPTFNIPYLFCQRETIFIFFTNLINSKLYSELVSSD